MNNPGNPAAIELIEVDVASAQDSDVRQIEDVNWRVQPGDFWVVGGGHASGKGDLIATAAGLLRPLRGSVRLFGFKVSDLSERELLEQRLKIGVVFKNGGRVFATSTVAENIALPLRYQFDWTFAKAADSVDMLLRLTGLTEYAHVAAGTLGINWQQRVGLARALALKPEVLFLDEPLAGLEMRHRQWWQEFLDQLSQGMDCTAGRPVTVAVVTNDVDPWFSQERQFAFIKRNRWIRPSGLDELKNLAHE